MSGTGWIARGYPNFDPTSPGQFSHDCFEHLPRGRMHGAIADEAMALGARLHLRVESGWWWKQRFSISPPDSFGNELERLMRDVAWGEQPPPAAIDEPLLDNEMDDEIEFSVIAGVKSANDEIGYNHPECTPYTGESELVQNLAAWMRRGYRACVARFKGRQPADIMWLAEQLDQATQEYKHGEGGDELTIR
ncbi:MAG: hypothetical protein WKG03_03645, partial [Telluria sp.]